MSSYCFLLEVQFVHLFVDLFVYVTVYLLMHLFVYVLFAFNHFFSFTRKLVGSLVCYVLLLLAFVCGLCFRPSLRLCFVGCVSYICLCFGLV